jgi:hypothetical protein
VDRVETRSCSSAQGGDSHTAWVAVHVAPATVAVAWQSAPLPPLHLRAPPHVEIQQAVYPENEQSVGGAMECTTTFVKTPPQPEGRSGQSEPLSPRSGDSRVSKGQNLD